MIAIHAAGGRPQPSRRSPLPGRELTSYPLTPRVPELLGIGHITLFLKAKVRLPPQGPGERCCSFCPRDTHGGCPQTPTSWVVWGDDRVLRGTMEGQRREAEWSWGGHAGGQGPEEAKGRSWVSWEEEEGPVWGSDRRVGRGSSAREKMAGKRLQRSGGGKAAEGVEPRAPWGS